MWDFILTSLSLSCCLQYRYQFSRSVVSNSSCPTLCNSMNQSTPGCSVHHQLLESTQTHVRWVGDAIQPSHPLLSPSPPALNLFQHQGLFKWISSSHQVAKVLEFQLQHQSSINRYVNAYSIIIYILSFLYWYRGIFLSTGLFPHYR